MQANEATWLGLVGAENDAGIEFRQKAAAQLCRGSAASPHCHGKNLLDPGGRNAKPDSSAGVSTEPLSLEPPHLLSPSGWGCTHCCTWGFAGTAHAAVALTPCSYGTCPSKGCVFQRLGTGVPGWSWLCCWPDMQRNSYHTVSVLSQPLQCQQRVVWLDYNIAHLILVWENRVGLHQLLGIPGEKAQPPQGLKPRSQHSLLPQAPFAVSRAQDSSESPALHARVSSRGGREFVPAVPTLAVREQAARRSYRRGQAIRRLIKQLLTSLFKRLQAETGRGGSSELTVRASHPLLHSEVSEGSCLIRMAEGRQSLDSTSPVLEALKSPGVSGAIPSLGSMPGIAQDSVWVGAVALSQRSAAPRLGRVPRLGQTLPPGKGTRRNAHLSFSLSRR